MEWDPRPYRNTGIWRCVIRRRERQSRYWHRSNGGYVTRRRRHLAGQRAKVAERLSELEQEVHRLAKP